MFEILTGGARDDHEDEVSRLPAPGYARDAGTVHVVAELLDQARGIAACGAWLRHAELWRRQPPGRLCAGCWSGEAVAVALRRP